MLPGGHFSRGHFLLAQKTMGQSPPAHPCNRVLLLLSSGTVTGCLLQSEAGVLSKSNVRAQNGFDSPSLCSVHFDQKVTPTNRMP